MFEIERDPSHALFVLDLDLRRSGQGLDDAAILALAIRRWALKAEWTMDEVFGFIRLGVALADSPEDQDTVEVQHIPLEKGDGQQE